MDKQQTMIIELNEFNLDLFKYAAESLDLRSLKRILSFNHGLTHADQLIEHQGLDPWVQWVSVHSESPSQEHGVIRLGDVSTMEQGQIWERLGNLGIKTGVWGVMNGARKNSRGNQFFVADPWSLTEAAYPPELNDFFSLPIYFSKNYLALSFIKILSNAIKTGWFMLRNIRLSYLLSDSIFLFQGLLRMKKLKTSFLFCAYELLAIRVFSKYRIKYNPQVNFIFLNTVAHFQHHDWHSSSELDATTKFIFRCVDRMLTIILPSQNTSERTLVLNGLSQRNVSEENHYCYRQINPERFLVNIGVKFDVVEQCMTNDAHVFFLSEMERDRGAHLLSSATIAGQQVFFVEKDSVNPLKLFYQVSVWHQLDDSSVLKFEEGEIPFFREFAIYAKRTGAHIPTGSYFSNGLSLPASINNCDVFSYVWPKE